MKAVSIFLAGAQNSSRITVSACSLIFLAILVLASYPLSADSELEAANAQGLPLLVAKVNADKQELESLLSEYVRWGGEVTHSQVLDSFHRFRIKGAELGKHRVSSFDRINQYLDWLGKSGTRRIDQIDATDVSADAVVSGSAVDVFVRTDRLLRWWEGWAFVMLERLGPDVAKLKEGDSIAHHRIRRQLDLLGDNLLALQLAAFERQSQIERSHELRDQRLSRSVRLAYMALGIGAALVLALLMLLLHFKAKSASQLQVSNGLLQARVEETHKLAAKLRHNATHDQLTGLYNRHGFVEELERAFEDDSATHGIVFIDLDGFKQVNDTAGHAAGDALLQQISTLLAEQAKHYGIAARFGGDEFVMLLPRCSSGTIKGVASGTCCLLSEMQFDAEGHSFPVAGSFGAVRFEPLTTTAEALMKVVDEACYHSKSRGGGCVAFRTLPADEDHSYLDNVTPLRRAV